MEAGDGSPTGPVSGSPPPTVGAAAAPTHRRHRMKRNGPSDRLLLPVVLVVGSLIIAARGPSAVFHPQLWAEDGKYWFHDAYTFGLWSPLRVAHTGYLQTFPRLVADLGLVIPLRQLPLLFVTAALAAQVLPAVLVASRRF
jgi:hypothetical protein